MKNRIVTVLYQYQYCVLNERNSGVTGEPYIAQYGLRNTEGGAMKERGVCWLLHDIVITNTILCDAYQRKVEEGSYIAQ